MLDLKDAWVQLVQPFDVLRLLNSNTTLKFVNHAVAFCDHLPVC